MKITSFSISNYRSLPDLTLSLGQKLVLVGPNDSGKSSVLRALHLTLAAASPANGVNAADFGDPKKPVVVEVDFDGLSADDKVAFADELTHAGGEATLRIRLEATVDPVDGEVTVDRTFPEFGNKRVPITKIAALGWAYVPATRSIARDVTTQRGGALYNLLGRIEIDDPEPLATAVAAFRDALNSVPGLVDLKSRLSTALSEALPNSVSPEALVLVAASELESNPLQDAALALSSDDELKPLDRQSDGLRALTALALHAVASESALVVGIDEPELHLHPPAQRRTGRILAAGPAQHIIATNSAHVLGEFHPTEVAALGRGRPVRVLPPGSAAEDDSFVLRWWASPMIEPLTADRVILVEGVTDRMVVLHASQTLGVDLDRLGIAVLSLDGANTINTVVQLYGSGGFGVPLSGLVDEDHRADWAQAFGVDPTDLGSVGVQVCTPDLEGQLVDSLGVARVLELLDRGGMREAAILGATGSPSGSPAPAALAEWMRHRRRKTNVAIAISPGLTAPDVAAVKPLNDLIVSVVS